MGIAELEKGVVNKAKSGRKAFVRMQLASRFWLPTDLRGLILVKIAVWRLQAHGRHPYKSTNRILLTLIGFLLVQVCI